MITSSEELPFRADFLITLSYLDIRTCYRIVIHLDIQPSTVKWLKYVKQFVKKTWLLLQFMMNQLCKSTNFVAAVEAGFGGPELFSSTVAGAALSSCESFTATTSGTSSG